MGSSRINGDLNRGEYKRKLTRNGFALDGERVLFLSDGELIVIKPIGYLYRNVVRVDRRATLAEAIRIKESEEKAGRKVERHILPPKPRPFLKQPPIRFLNLTVWYAGE
jgi:hypothetical protein